MQLFPKANLVLICTLLITSCNPVKQVLKDNSKFNIVAEEVIRRGYCINDTIVETKVDTLYQADSSVVNTISSYKEIDTTFTDGSTLRIDSAGNVSFGCPVKVQYKTVTKTETIRDKALESILKKDIVKLDSIKFSLEKDLFARKQLISSLESDLKKANRKFKGFIAVLVAGLLGSIYLKFRGILPF